MNWPSLERSIKAPKQLLVEGRTPEIFFREWIEAVGLKGQVEARNYGSLADLAPYLKLFVSYREFSETVTSLAVIRDAEDKPALSAFDSVCAALRTVGLACPDGLASFSGGMPRTGVFVLPDCARPGMLETLCWAMLERDQKLAPHLDCVDAYLACVRRNGAKIRNGTKARVWTYLAGMGQFDPQVGRAAQAKIWDWNSPALQALSGFLKAM